MRPHGFDIIVHVVHDITEIFKYVERLS